MNGYAPVMSCRANTTVDVLLGPPTRHNLEIEGAFDNEDYMALREQLQAWSGGLSGDEDLLPEVPEDGRK